METCESGELLRAILSGFRGPTLLVQERCSARTGVSNRNLVSRCRSAVGPKLGEGKGGNSRGDKELAWLKMEVKLEVTRKESVVDLRARDGFESKSGRGFKWIKIPLGIGVREAGVS